nr:immunoglobulin heavy chain junction region [Macaca mulatta]MOV49162.1 immunoglobulin heavy chain junction region [Macaca mulatta]MOV49338.1 immunoglobulin heavy chain junction region [Macaca mulatta]MOV49546.1 immunoglobulin heavy chain junction region [Macaca mulatta]MOV49641.1 immunoglobulin heavy chain junction region [Macaca mulatta]
CARDHSSFDVW